ncbi:hypothetical protein [Clostridium psychrophilum]|uniref:hypothetical protein n=1 Tax=Clostridium psychrophilum TaxID=132926 RepID=UPI001C0DB608|nr:hypothetical protein [Clostridium psychrophilum]MBU3182522.1 hypothetical protein [Clostridium psychrophilum]
MNNNDKHTMGSDRIILSTIAVITLVLFVIVSLPSVILTIVLTLVLINTKKVKKIYFCIASFVLAVLVNLKINFMQKYLVHSIKFLNTILDATIHKKTSTLSTLYKNYILNINIVWQLLIALILSSIFAEIYYIKRQKEKKSKSKTEKRKENEPVLEKKKFTKIDLDKTIPLTAVKPYDIKPTEDNSKGD